MGTRLLSLVLAAWASALPAQDPPLPPVQDGDLIFQTTHSGQSRAIQLATHSPYCHVGLVFIEDGRPQVYEAVQPVRKTPLAHWIRQGQEGRYALKRLRPQRALKAPALAKVRLAAAALLGKDYDWAFGWSDSRLYCSELVWKAYQRGAGLELCPTRKLKDFDLKSKAVKRKLRERYGKKIPLEETVVAPSDLFDSSLLEDVGPASPLKEKP